MCKREVGGGREAKKCICVTFAHFPIEFQIPGLPRVSIIRYFVYRLHLNLTIAAIYRLSINTSKNIRLHHVASSKVELDEARAKFLLP